MDFGSNEYLVLTHRAADELRRLAGRNLSREEAADTFLAMLRGGSRRERRSTPYGEIVHVATDLNGRAVEVALSYGIDKKSGRPLVAPDGVKRVVFAVGVWRA